MRPETTKEAEDQIREIYSDLATTPCDKTYEDSYQYFAFRFGNQIVRIERKDTGRPPSIDREAAILKHLNHHHKTNKFPHLIDFNLAARSIRTSYVPGVPYPQIKEHLNRRENLKILRKIAQLQFKIHSTPLSDLTNDQLIMMAEPYLKPLFKKTLTTKNGRAKLFNIFNEETSPECHLGICHRDLSPQNVIYNEETKSIGIIDFGTASIDTRQADPPFEDTGLISEYEAIYKEIATPNPVKP